MVFQISYELKNSDKNYSDLFTAIENLGPSVHFLRDAWWVEPNESMTVDTIVDLLRNYMSEGDRIHIIDITNKRTNGWLARTSWDWLKARSNIS